MKAFVLFFLLLAVAQAEPPPTLQLTLPQALDLAEQANPELRLVRQGVEVARGGVTRSGHRPNPTMGIYSPVGPAERKQQLMDGG